MSEMKTPIKTINGHALVDAEARAGVEENGKTISRLTEEIAGEPIADYLVEEVKKVTNTLQTVQYAHPKSATFAFMTDLHFHYNREALLRRNLRSIDEIAKTCPVSFIAHGGDNLAESESNLERTLDLATRYGKLLRDYKTRSVIVKGNHDDSSINGYIKEGKYTLEYVMTDPQYYARCFRHNENVFNIVMDENRDKLYFYVDLPSQQIRVIFLNVIDIPIKENENGELVYKGQNDYGYSNDQLNWVAHDALNFEDKAHPEQWGVITVQHITDCPYIPSFTDSYVNQEYNGAQMYQIFQAFRNRTTYESTRTDGDFPHSVSCDFTNAKQELICRISGHTHKDWNITYAGVLYISTLSSGPNGVGTGTSMDGVKYDKVDGTADESAFDFFTVDKENRSIYATRYGVGIDRVFEWVAGAIVNLFTYGASRDDWCKKVGEEAAGSLVVNNADGYVQQTDSGGGSSYGFRKTNFTNDGSTFRVTANSDAVETGYYSACRFLLRAFDADGNVIQDAVAGVGSYNTYYNACLYSPYFGDGIMDDGSITPSLDISFTLPENVHSFQIGFIFKELNGTVNTHIKISDITLTKE